MKNKLFHKTCLILAIVWAIFLVRGSVNAATEDVSKFYQGKNLIFVVGWSPGGGYDTYARLLAPLLGKALRCTVVVQNMPGAGGLVAMNHMFNSASRDGLTISITPTGLPLVQALGLKGVKFDCSEFNWLASVMRDQHVIGVSPKSPHNSLDDLRKLKTARAAVTDLTSPLGQPIIMAAEAIGMSNLKVIPGYPGSTECILAVNRGEADFTAVSHFSSVREKGLLRPLVAIDMVRASDVPDVPSLIEVGIKEEAKRMLEILFAGRGTGRGIITSPGVNKERIDFLRKNILTCLKSSEFKEKANKMSLEVDPLPGEQMQVLAQKSVRITTEEQKRLKNMFEKYIQ